MSPVFTPDFASVDANIHIYEKGRFQVQVTKRTPFSREKTTDGNVSVLGGVRFGLEMVGQFDDDGDIQTDGLKGKVVSPYTVWLHTEGGWQFGKTFIMAACGYNVRRQEQEANENLFQGDDISWDCSGDVDAPPESFELGNGWDIPVGRRVDVTLSKSVTQSKDGETTYENQEYGGWAPVEG